MYNLQHNIINVATDFVGFSTESTVFCMKSTVFRMKSIGFSRRSIIVIANASTLSTPTNQARDRNDQLGYTYESLHFAPI